MPLFQYTCTDCDHDFEMLVNRGDKIECPKCRSKKLDKQPSLPGMPQVKDAFPSACGDPSLPPCGAPGCRRTGKP
jgi:putative FmdB family regulatory protein